jgi:hypothetical protein
MYVDRGAANLGVSKRRHVDLVERSTDRQRFDAVFTRESRDSSKFAAELA